MKTKTLTAFFLLLAISMVAYIGPGKQTQDGPSECASCHVGYVLTDTNGAHILHREDKAGRLYTDGGNKLFFEMLIASGNSTQGWEPDTVYNQMAFAIDFRDTLGNPAAIVYGCECSTGGAFNESGSFAESVTPIPMEIYYPDALAPWQANGSVCSMQVIPLHGYRGRIIADLHLVANDSTGNFPFDMIAYASDTLEYVQLRTGIDYDDEQSRKGALRFFITGQEGGNMYLEGGKLKVRVR